MRLRFIALAAGVLAAVAVVVAVAVESDEEFVAPRFDDLAPVAPPAPPSRRVAGTTGRDGFHVAQHDGVAMWSRRGARDHVLVMRRGGRARRVAAVAPATDPFDVDIGEDGSGRTVAVYTRCAGDRPARCAVYAYDVAARTERRVSPHGGRWTYLEPALHRGVLAFVRIRAGARRAAVMTAPLRAVGRARVVHRPRVDGARGVLGVDVGAHGIAYAVYATPEGRTHGTYLLWLERPGRAPRVVSAGSTGEENTEVLASPGFAGRALYWAWTNDREHTTIPAHVVRLDLATRRVTAAPVLGYLDSVAADAAWPSAPPLVVTADLERREQRVGRIGHEQFDSPLSRVHR